MSQYYGNTRTNYFKVTDPEKFRNFMAQIMDQEGDAVNLWDFKNQDGETKFVFGCYSSLVGIASTETRIRKIVFDACAKAFEEGHLTEDILPSIFEVLELNKFEYNKDEVTNFFFELTKKDDFSDDEDVDVEHSYDEFIEGLQSFLPDGEVVAIIETGHEKLRYVGGYVVVITNNDCKTVDLYDVATYLAQQMTNDPNKLIF